MRNIREDYLSDSTVTIFLIGKHGSENEGEEEQVYIKRVLQASLFDDKANSRNGILGIVLPDMYNKIYIGSGICTTCGNSHSYVNVNDSTTIKEFLYNYYIPHNKFAWSEDDRYCVLIKWGDFKKMLKVPKKYIDKEFDKRKRLIAEKVKIYPK